MSTLKMCLFFVLITSKVYSQAINSTNTLKLSPLLIKKLKTYNSEQGNDFIVVVRDINLFIDYLKQNKISFRLLYKYDVSKTVLIEIKWRDIIEKILSSPLVVFVDEKRIAREELLVGDYDLGTNKINTIHADFPQWNGNNIVLSVKENNVDTTDIDLRGRYLSTPMASSINTSHATVMATIAAGGGNTYYQGKGAAWGSTISSSDFASLLPDADQSYQQFHISVQNHSYGTGIENYYGADAAAYDASTIDNTSLLHVFSAGNSGLSASSEGPYAGVADFANITGSFKMAKNIITVGHTDSFGTVLERSSKGPAYDGRIKPELVAYGEDGSSGAAALVSGISLVLQEAYKQQHNDSLPSSALIKSILLNSADDVETTGIDFKSGYGALNAYKATKTLIAGRFFAGNLSNGNVQMFNLNIPGGIKELKLTLVWNDPPSAPNATKALINDLDLELVFPSTAESWKPWVLNSFPAYDSLIQLPVRKRDSLNNAEQITLKFPAAGNYTIKITGYNVVTASQNFYVAYQLDSMDTFQWYYPTRSDNIFPGKTNTLRWESGFSFPTGLLEYSTDDTIWNLINSSVDLGKGFYNWETPDSFFLSKLRISFAGKHFLSDTFTISNPVNIKVGFNCPDSFLIYWNRIAGITDYEVFSLGDKFLEPLTKLNDTALILGKNSNPSLYYSVAPVIKDKVGIKSFTLNYSLQGVGCYLKSFLVQLLTNNTIEMNLQLGTAYNIKKISWEKFTLNGYQTLDSITPVISTDLSFIDVFPTNGVNTYRVKIDLNGGKTIYSSPETVYYFQKSNYIIYPNPASQYQAVRIINKEFNDGSIQVFNAIGMKVYESTMNDITHTIPPGFFSKGLYYIRIVTEGKRDEKLKLVIF